MYRQIAAPLEKDRADALLSQHDPTTNCGCPWIDASKDFPRGKEDFGNAEKGAIIKRKMDLL